jgi:hypothetical protein
MQIIVGIPNGRQSQTLGPWWVIGSLCNFRSLAFQWKIYAIMKACLQASRLPLPFKFHVNKSKWSAFPSITRISWQCFSCSKGVRLGCHSRWVGGYNFCCVFLRHVVCVLVGCMGCSIPNLWSFEVGSIHNLLPTLMMSMAWWRKPSCSNHP